MISPGLPPEIAERVVVLRDLLKHEACTHSAQCSDITNTFHEAARKKLTKPIWKPFTREELTTLDPAEAEGHRHAGACFSLDRFRNMDEVLEAARVGTSRRGRVTREIQKARRLGYTTKRFAKALYVPDMWEIHQSKDLRGGKPMRESYQKTIEEMGGAPRQPLEPPPPQCPLHDKCFWGVFKPEEGHKQGDVTTNERLVGYISLWSYGSHAWYSRIMGHGEHLSSGIMYLLHFSVVEDFLARPQPRPEYLFYGAFRSGPKSGTLTEWKRRCLFEPRLIVLSEGVT